ncbi:MAG: ABC transporter permease [Candidatus Methanomethylophilaceae archaeon]|nr:ABC transporter permease [Candidatus Methanomethylophilaceae archaeon]
MNHLVNIIRKELKELLTPGSVASVLVMMVLFSALGSMIGGEMDKATAVPVFGIDNAEAGEIDIDGYHWSAIGYLRNLYVDNIPEGKSIDDYVIDLNTKPGSDVYERMQSAGVESAIVIPEDFADRISREEQTYIDQVYLYQPTGMFGTVSSSVLSMVVSNMNSNLSAHLVASVTDSTVYKFYLNPILYGDDHVVTVIDGKAYGNITPSDISNELSGQTMLIPLIIMIMIMMVGSIVISSMGTEKENKTLETLLTLPIKRTTIVTGKILAAAVIGLIYGLAYMLGMSMYMGALTKNLISDVSLEDIGLGLSGLDYLFLLLSMFLSIACALSLCMVLGAFAKNYKSAQTMTMPLSIMAMIPMFIIMFSGWYGSGIVVKALLFVIPFSHPMMAMDFLMFDDYTPVFAGLIYMAAFAATAIMVTVRLYRSDILITGLGQNKTVQTILNRK